MIPDILLILLLMVTGWIVQQGGFCLVAAVSRAMEKRPERLLLIMGIALTSALVILLFQVSGRHSPTGKTLWWALGGAVLFGFGAGLNRGCFFGTLSKLARGDGHMLLTLGGMLTTAAYLPASFTSVLSDEQSDPQLLLCLFLLMVCLLSWLRCGRRDRLRRMVQLLIPGLTFGFLYSTGTGWSLSQLLTEAWRFIRYGEIISDMRLMGFAAFMLGMGLYHLRHNEFSIRHLSAIQGLKHFSAGAIMMTGSRMMGGGNDNLLFNQLPSLTPAIFLLLMVMLLSIATTLSVTRRYRKK